MWKRRHVRRLGKTDGVDANRPPAVGPRLVGAADRVERLLDGIAGELISEHEDRRTLVGRPVAAHRFHHAGNGIGLTEGAPLPGALADVPARLGRVGEPAAAGPLVHVGSLVVHDLQALHVRVQAEELLHDAEVHLPVIAGHAGGSVDDEDDVFAVERNAADVRRARALRALRDPALHLLGEGLLPGHQLALDDVGHRGILAAAGVAALAAAEIAGEARELAALALEGLATPHELAVELIGLPADYVQLLLEEPHLAARSEEHTSEL